MCDQIRATITCVIDDFRCIACEWRDKEERNELLLESGDRRQDDGLQRSALSRSSWAQIAAGWRKLTRVVIVSLPVHSRESAVAAADKSPLSSRRLVVGRKTIGLLFGDLIRFRDIYLSE